MRYHYLTGGHPECVTRVLKMYAKEPYTPNKFIEIFKEKIWKDIVSLVVEEVKTDIPSELLKVFNALSIFRFFDNRILKQLIEDQTLGLSQDKDSFHLEDQTYCYTLDSPLQGKATSKG